MQIVAGQRVGDDSATRTLALDEAALRAVSDPWERARLATELAAQLQARSAEVFDVRRDAVRELVLRRGETRTRVARYLGMSPARIGQLVMSLRVHCGGGVMTNVDAAADQQHCPARNGGAS
jgi:protein involved in temperature-dependent protein secretion